MDATRFVLRNLRKFPKKFPNARVRYESNDFSNDHIIEVTPLAVYRSQEFLEWAGDLFDRFIKKYIYEGITFISEDAIVPIEDVMFEATGKEYVAPPADRQVETDNSVRNEKLYATI